MAKTNASVSSPARASAANWPLVVAAIGDAGSDRSHQVLWTYDSSVRLSDMFTSVSGRRLPAGSRPTIAPGLSPADHDLATRLLNRPGDGTWWALDLSGADVERPGYGRFHHEAQGQLQPILTDGLGDPVVAAWIPPSNDQRWYIIPDGTDWDAVLGWLSQQALPEYVPGALRRARSPHFRDPDLQTTDELAARQAMEELEARYAEERLDLQQALRDAEGHAGPVRYGLLYGTGAELVRAVNRVLTAAGLQTIDLDEELGGTKSADLLVGADGPTWRLVEVKAAGGSAGENLVSYLQRHLETWPQMGRGELVSGGVLIVNHQHRLHPSERAAAVYSRPEFVDSLSVTVLSTIELFHWWRTADWPAIRAAVLGADSSHATTDPVAGEDATTPPAPPSRGPRSWFGRQNQ